MFIPDEENINLCLATSLKIYWKQKHLYQVDSSMITVWTDPFPKEG